MIYMVFLVHGWQVLQKFKQCSLMATGTASTYRFFMEGWKVVKFAKRCAAHCCISCHHSHGEHVGFGRGMSMEVDFLGGHFGQIMMFYSMTVGTVGIVMRLFDCHLPARQYAIRCAGHRHRLEVTLVRKRFDCLVVVAG